MMDFTQLPLRPMQQPEMIGWWPLAPGWWLLLLIIIVLGVLVYKWLKRFQNNPRRWALMELKKIKQQYQQHQDKRRLAEHCNALLKRSALTLFSRQAVAALSGESWIQFLQQHSQNDQRLSVLATAPYQAQPDYDAEQLLTACQQWLNKVKPPSVRGESHV